MKYEITQGNLNEVQEAEVNELQNKLYDLKELAEKVNNDLETMKFQLQKKMEEFGITKIENDYFKISYVPATEPTVKKVLNEKAVDELLEELGMVKDTFMDEKTVSGRKAYIRWSNK